jgi:hypothetical protein
LSLLKNFFWILQAAVGRPCISNMGCLDSDMPTAHLRQAPFGAWVSVLDVEGGLRLLRKYSAGTSCPSPSVIGIALCLLGIVNLRFHVGLVTSVINLYVNVIL